jgi:hypothetical protein
MKASDMVLADDNSTIVAAVRGGALDLDNMNFIR